MKFIPIAAAVFCASCDGQAIDPSQSLVGARSIPSARQLSRETIEIYRESIEPGPRLIYDLLPNDTVTVTLTDWIPDESIIGKRSFHLSNKVARNAREALWRLRPEQLQGMASDTQLTGCPQPPLEEYPDFTVGFIADGPKTADQVGQIGIFRLYPSCKTPGAVETRALLQEVLSQIPQSGFTAEYERRNELLKAKLKSLKPQHRFH